MNKFRIATGLAVMMGACFFSLVVKADEDNAGTEKSSAAASSDALASETSQTSSSVDVTVQEPSSAAGTEEAASSETLAAAQESTAASEAVSPSGNVTVDFKEADIQNVLRILSFKSGMNIVAGKDVTGTVTIRLVNVPWEKALDVVLKTYGYAYDRDGNIIRVTTLENLKKEELSTEVYTLNYAQAAEVERSLKDILSERGKVRSDSRSNTVIVTDMPTTLQRVSKVIERLDRATPQVIIEAKVIETTLGTVDRLGINWNLSMTVKGAARPTTFPFQPQEERTNLYSQFFPEGRGAQTAATEGNAVSTQTTIQDFPTGSFTHQPSFPVVDKNQFTFGTLDFSQFQAVLNLIQTRNDAKILSEPHVVTLNNKEAKILVGEKIAVPRFERNSTTGRMEITGYSDRDLGIRLSVTPQINDANEIVVDIHPEITSLLGYDELTPDIKAPRFSTREAQTQVRIKNGQTIAIGGLIKENIVDDKSKVPLLGDLPILNNLFKHSNKSVQKTDLLFFMTVNVVPDKPAIAVAAPQNKL